ncbi:hypothetical protein PHMEG_000267 [Phytophthora megakarya]|uniref:Bromo domain-containing protein n=1 Tax=Phytophthora megakarya TaxID=4795 RepID=A0A225X5N5_9STRA|nr:hypothetical protein PHMEG_000267 [Phytophthora megakarya]
MISEAAHAECVRLLELLTNPRVQESWSWVFMTPVDIPGYDRVIKKPMDLGTIKKNLGSKPSRCRFKSHEKFARDVRLVFHNALVYNKDDQDVKGSVYAAAQHLLRVFETAYAKAIDSVFKADDAAVAAAKAAHREAKEEKRRTEGDATKPEASSSSSSHHHHSSSHHHREEGEESSKHKHKHKKDKKSKKSKKKSKDKDREHRHSSSSSGEKKKSHRSEQEGGVVSSSAVSKEAVAERTAVPAPPAPNVSVVPQSSSLAVKRELTPTHATGTKSMSDSDVTACLSLLMKLVKYKEGNISPAAPFLQPVDLTHFPDYRVKVPNRMHLYGVQKKLRSGSYPTIDAFAYDMRLIFSNCLVYNSDVILSKVMRNHAVTLMKLFESQFVKIGGSWPGVPERWKCHQIIHEILAHRTDGQETAQWFKYPIESYYDSPDQIPYNYYKTVTEPMDIGTVSTNLHLGKYKHVSEFVAGMKLVFDNCIRYWKPDPQGKELSHESANLAGLTPEEAKRLRKEMKEKRKKEKKEKKEKKKKDKEKKREKKEKKERNKLSSQVRDMSAHLMWYFDSLCAELQIVPATEIPAEQSRTKRDQLRRERAEFVNTVPVELKAKECQKLLRVLNSQKYDKNCWPFRKPVRVLFPALSADYFEIIKTPMDLTTVADKLTEFEYKVHGEFIRDVRLTFENAMTYNRADKDREGWSVYSAAVHMLAVVDDLWGDVTLEVTEKTRRRELLRKERMNDSKRKRSETSELSDDREKKTYKHHHEANGSRDDASASDSTATRVKLQLMPNRPNMERMNKQERKAEEKRRKRARREEEMARTEKRRRTAVAATDDALREAEIRSRRKLQKFEMAEAVRLREERERRAAEDEAERARRAQMKLNTAAWTGVLVPATSTKSSGFWARKRTKLQIPAVFQPPAINA